MRNSRWASPDLQSWLGSSETRSDSYSHFHLTEVEGHREKGLAALTKLSREAHADAQVALERLYRRSLDPLSPENAASPDELVYPDSLETVTLQGYLGETLAGLVAENYEPHDCAWTVPAFLFRWHNAAGEAIERARQLGIRPTKIPGRTGDDAVAFRRDASGRIDAWIFGEAKCTRSHKRSLIDAAHTQLSQQIWRPINLGQMIQVLEARGESGDAEWIAALEELLLRSADDAPERFDMFVYVHGKAPVKTDTWIKTDSPEPEYTAGHRLAAVEIRLDGVLAVLRHIFPRHQLAA